MARDPKVTQPSPELLSETVLTRAPFSHRVIFYLVILVTYAALYGRSMTWGWCGLDDYFLLGHNEHLGHSLHSFFWGWTDMTVGTRWLPVVWTLANLFSGWGATGFHVGTLVVGAILSVSIFRLFEERLPTKYALWPALIFAVSPQRWEIFGFAIGFVYASSAVFAVWSIIFLLRDRRVASAVMMVLATIAYPIAAGGLVLVAWINRKNWIGPACLLVVGSLFSLQYVLSLHAKHGVAQFDLLSGLLVVPHYVFSILVPIATMPLVPPVLHWGLFPGALIAVLGLIKFPRESLACLLIFSPVVLASVVDFFMFSGRYALFLTVAILFLSHKIWWNEKVRMFGSIYIVGLVLASSFHTGYRSQADVLLRTHLEDSILFPTEK